MTAVPVESLQRTNTRLIQLIANLEGGVLMEDETRHINLVNPAFVKMFGLLVTPEDLIGTDCSGSAEASKHLFTDPDGFVRRINELLAARENVTGEVLHLTDGRVFSRDYIPVFDEDEYIGHLWHYHDITSSVRARNRMERLLKFEEVNQTIARLFLQLDDTDRALNRALAITGHLLDVSRVYVFRIRENARILDNTHEWCAPGIKPEIENLQGLPFDDLFPSLFPMIAENDLIAPDHISDLPQDLRDILEPQDIQTILWMPMYLDNRIEGFVGYDETRHPRTWLPEEITMARILMESYAHALERKQTERMLVAARDEAIRTAQLRAQFVANMSHEIRTPMTGIMGMLELLIETEMDELQREFAGEALGSSTRLLTIINDILDFSKLEAGQIVLEAEPIDLTAIATEVKTTLAPQIKVKPVELRLEIDAQTPKHVHGDATRIRQVLMNLAGNAVKFTQEGRVTLSIEIMRVQDNIAYVRFAVQDTGVGIAQENLERIFESFVQADGSTTRKFGGSGLGLSISRQLVELMGGKLKAESEAGEGSTFSFMLRLPISKNATGEIPVTPDFSQLHVLIVDDDRTGSYVLAQQLRNWGVQVTQVHNWEAEFARFDAASFDLVLRRCRRDSPDCRYVPELERVARRVYFVIDRQAAVPSDQLVLRWPVNASSLYNALTSGMPKSPELPVKSAPDSQSKGRVLLAEDSEINVELVERALAGIDVLVDCVENGQKALERLTEQTYDLILMDIQMPIMDGLATTKHIRQADATYRDVPIIALTASIMPEERESYLEIGINDIIGKPFSVRGLRQTVLDWLARETGEPSDSNAG